MKGFVLLLMLAQLTPRANDDLLRNSITAVESEAVAEAARPLEQWLGRRLVVFEKREALPPHISVALFPAEDSPGEALVTPLSIFVPRSRFQEFRSSLELAEFLSHAAAHARLNHPQRLSEKLHAARVLAGTHAPEKYSATMIQDAQSELEAEVAPVAAEILATADCGPGPCAMFGRLLGAVRR